MSPRRIESPSGLVLHASSNGSISRIDCGDITLNTFRGTELEGGPTNIYLRRLDGDCEFTPLLGPNSPAAFAVTEQGLVAHGVWQDLELRVELVLASAAPAWFWHVTLRNRGARAARVDLIHAADVSLAHYGAIRNNEYYTSHYLDWTPLEHAERGVVLAARQNLAMGGRHPWALFGALGRATRFATDAIQLHGLARRAAEPPPGLLAEHLESRRRQHEHGMAVLQHAPIVIEPGRSAATGYFGRFVPDHEAASGVADLKVVEDTLALPEARVVARGATASQAAATPAAPSVFTTAAPLVAGTLSPTELDSLFGAERREEERNEAGLLSFFVGEHRHVVLAAKERAVLRPHGSILRTGRALVPDEAALSSTVWMCGVFNSLLTQGHVNINRFVSATHGYLSLFKADGQRVFIETPGGLRLLDLPSAFEMSPSAARWIYKHDDGVIEVRTSASLEEHAIALSIRVLAGGPARFLITTRIAIDGDDGAAAGPAAIAHDGAGVIVRPSPRSEIGARFPSGHFRIDADSPDVLEQVGGDELLYADGRSRGEPFLVLRIAPLRAVELTITGHLVETVAVADPSTIGQCDDADEFAFQCAGATTVHPPGESSLATDAARIGELLPWLARDALVHYLAPHGLEQYAGGGWGTRDVCQGPVELLLALGEHAAIRDLLLRVFAAQNPDGDWPQWFMFFERERGIRAPDSHGDIVFWPLLALGQYLVASEDGSILDVVVPFFDLRGDAHAETVPLWVHAERALALISARVVPGTALAVYGNGDWNDSLQPANPSLKERLVSSWTVALHRHTLRTLAAGLLAVGRRNEAEGVGRDVERILAELRERFIVDGVLAGLGLFQPDGSMAALLHPNDRWTGMSASLLAIAHGILYDVFTREEAATHRDVIQRSLLAADGARLFDAPPRYAGGSQTHFQRAETSAYFGREIGVMYTHAHLRYAEAMARYGDADAFFLALRQANPIALGEVVPSAALRQANCYTSSSDAAFADRYEASERYEDVRSGNVAFEGGWRVYSSGAGIMLRLIHERFLGVERRATSIVFDPVVPVALDGLEVELPLCGTRATVRYRTGRRGRGPVALLLNGARLKFESLPNPYRTGAAQVTIEDIREHLTDGRNVLEISLE